jgi:hypothetical protein
MLRLVLTPRTIVPALALAVIVLAPAPPAAGFGYVFAGQWGTAGVGSGQLDFPTGIAVDSLGQVYVLEA